MRCLLINVPVTQGPCGAHGGDRAVTESQAGVCAGSGLWRGTGEEGARRWLVVATSQ